MALTSKQIAELNKRFSDGIFFEAIAVQRDPDASPIVTDYFANHPTPFTLGGNEYQPLEMVFPDQRSDASMSLPRAAVNLSNAGNKAINYVEDDELGVVVAHNEVRMQVIHRDKLGNYELYRESVMQLTVATDNGEEGDKPTVTLHLGLNVRLEDKIPAETIEVTTAPALRQDISR